MSEEKATYEPTSTDERSKHLAQASGNRSDQPESAGAPTETEEASQQAEQQAEAEVTEEQPPAAASTAKRWQGNRHDAKHHAEDCLQLEAALAKYGVSVQTDTVNPLDLRPRIEAYAACRMLVAKGVCTEDEMRAMVFEVKRDILANILHVVEVQRLQQQQQARAVQPVKQPLVIAKH